MTKLPILILMTLSLFGCGATEYREVSCRWDLNLVPAEVAPSSGYNEINYQSAANLACRDILTQNSGAFTIVYTAEATSPGNGYLAKFMLSDSVTERFTDFERSFKNGTVMGDLNFSDRARAGGPIFLPLDLTDDKASMTVMLPAGTAVKDFPLQVFFEIEANQEISK